MLLYTCARGSTYADIAKYGLRQSGMGHRLPRNFEAAQKTCDGRILVIEFSKADLERFTIRDDVVIAPAVPLTAFRNVNPYAPVERIGAGGGLVVRRNEAGLQVLLIHRRGVWDLPKGKLDPGESVEQCARREVVEELGLKDQDIEVVCPIGRTVHGYREDDKFMLKRTHWFLMRTSSSSFRPQAEEDIDAVDWVAWNDAQKTVRFDTLRDLLKAAKTVASENTRT
ncbi:MAG: NUDIX hydrolase [Rhodothermia bacterium]|nr:NUDIX hydrolase [Rhodothermia bacterium]